MAGGDRDQRIEQAGGRALDGHVAQPAHQLGEMGAQPGLAEADVQQGAEQGAVVGAEGGVADRLEQERSARLLRVVLARRLSPASPWASQAPTMAFASCLLMPWSSRSSRTSSRSASDVVLPWASIQSTSRAASRKWTLVRPRALKQAGRPLQGRHQVLGVVGDDEPAGLGIQRRQLRDRQLDVRVRAPEHRPVTGADQVGRGLEQQRRLALAARGADQLQGTARLVGSGLLQGLHQLSHPVAARDAVAERRAARWASRRRSSAASRRPSGVAGRSGRPGRRASIRQGVAVGVVMVPWLGPAQRCPDGAGGRWRLGTGRQ